MSVINFAVRSETGHVRNNNEDNFFCNGLFMNEAERDKPFFITGTADGENPSVFAVCDGMGGEDCGELASLTAVKTLSEHFENIRHGAFEDVKDFVSSVNKKLVSFMHEQNIFAGTTLALVVVNAASFTAYNLGDSRIYRAHAGGLVKITDDHTVAEDKLRFGILTPKQAEKSSERNILTRYMGISHDIFSDTPDANGPYEFNERIMLCSDGLTDMLRHREILEIMNNAENVSDAVNYLVDRALDNGGKDNVTCIVIEKAR